MITVGYFAAKEITVAKTFPKYLEDMIPDSGDDCIESSAPYRNFLRGREPTIFADYAQYLRARYPNDASFLMVADLIEIHHGEERSHVFFDFFPGSVKRYRIDERTASPSRGWRLDQDRRCRDQLPRYDEWGYLW
jgi:hypothetical protein